MFTKYLKKYDNKKLCTKDCLKSLYIYLFHEKYPPDKR